MTYSSGPSVTDSDLASVNMTEALLLAANADIIVACLGEGTYAEKPGDIEDLSLAEGQRMYIEALAETGTPIVTVLVEGRPRLLNGVAELSTALLMAYQPGPMGGQAIVDALYNQNGGSPAGRLPFTYPKNPSDIPYQYHRKPSDMCVDASKNYVQCTVSLL